MLTKTNKKKRFEGWHRQHKLTLGLVIIAAVSLVIAGLTLYLNCFRSQKLTIDDLYDTSSVKDKLDFQSCYQIYPVVLYELNDSINIYYSTNCPLEFTIHNYNEFSVLIEKMLVEVTEFRPYDSYIAIYHDKKKTSEVSVDELQPIPVINKRQINTCTLRPYKGRYYILNAIDHNPTYLKLAPNDCDIIRFYLRADTEGLYSVKLVVKYSLQGEKIDEQKDIHITIAQEPSRIDYERNAFYYDDSTIELIQNKHKLYECCDIKENIPNHISRINREDDVERFLGKYNKNNTYKNIVMEVLDYFDKQ